MEGFHDPEDFEDAPKFAELADMDVGDLLDLRAQIDAQLPPMSLNALNLEEELVVQYQVVKALQQRTLASDTEEANRKAQVANTCANVLQQLIKMQSEFHTAERLKAIESRLIKALEKVPEQYLIDFFNWYESEDTHA